MFDGIMLLCQGAKDKDHCWERCLHSVVVPESCFLKLANCSYRCSACGNSNDKIKDYFISLIKLRETSQKLFRSGHFVRSYELVFMGAYEEGFDLTPYLLENRDWANWNMQVCSITVCDTEIRSKGLELWENYNLQFRHLIYPGNQKMTFNGAIRRKSLSVGGFEIDKELMASVIRELRSLNKSWIQLIDGYTSAAPIDLKHSLYCQMARVDSLIEFVSDEDLT